MQPVEKTSAKVKKRYFLLVNRETRKIVRSANVTNKSFKYIKTLLFGWQFDYAKCKLINIEKEAE